MSRFAPVVRSTYVVAPVLLDRRIQALAAALLVVGGLLLGTDSASAGMGVVNGR